MLLVREGRCLWQQCLPREQQDAPNVEAEPPGGARAGRERQDHQGEGLHALSERGQDQARTSRYSGGVTRATVAADVKGAPRGSLFLAAALRAAARKKEPSFVGSAWGWGPTRRTPRTK